MEERRVNRIRFIVRRCGGSFHLALVRNRLKMMKHEGIEMMQSIQEWSDLMRACCDSIESRVRILAIRYIMGADARVPSTIAAEMRSGLTLYSTA